VNRSRVCKVTCGLILAGTSVDQANHCLCLVLDLGSLCMWSLPVNAWPRWKQLGFETQDLMIFASDASCKF